MLKKLKLIINTAKSTQFKQALNTCAKELNRIKLTERKANYELKQAYKQEKLSQAKMYDEERKGALIRLFAQAIVSYKAEQIIDHIKSGTAETIFD